MSRAFVSYSWTVEDKTGVVADIQRLCDEHEVKLVLDKREVDYGESIPKFMEEIGQARWVFIVLSEEYFRSEYCMFEMLKVFERGEVGSRVQAVLLDRTWLGGDRRSQFSKELEIHWNQRGLAERERAVEAKKSATPETAKILNRRADLFDSIAESVAEFLQHFADRRLEPLGESRQAVLARVVKRVVATRKLRTDAQFVEAIGGCTPTARPRSVSLDPDPFQQHRC